MRDLKGNALTHGIVSWFTSDTTIATVDKAGVVRALAPGAVIVTAMSRGEMFSANVTVQAHVGSEPGTVSDLSVSEATDSSVTLSFSQVGNGSEDAAAYQVKYSVAGSGEETAVIATSGTCALPLENAEIGETDECTVLGLNGSTRYNFQVLAYRGTVGVDAVYGPSSNVAEATTTGGLLGVPAYVAITPGSLSLTTGESEPLTAAVKDVAGNVLPGQQIAWSSSRSTIASVDGEGNVTGVRNGTVSITARAAGKTATASVTVGNAGPPSEGWPNEPAGLTLYTDQKWDALNEWTLEGNELGNPIITTRADSPFPDKKVLQYLQPTGMLGGGGGGTPGPGSANFAITGRALPTELFVGAWIKVGNPYTPPPSTGQKLWYIGDAAQGASGAFGVMWVEFWGTPGATLPYERPHVALVNQMTADAALYQPNVTQTELQVGKWHQYEMYFKQPATSSSNDGVVKVWIDGVLNISLTSVPGRFTGGRGFSNFNQNMQWGGGGVIAQDQYVWATHNRISGR